MSRGPSTIQSVLFNETHSVEVRGQPGAIPPQIPPQKRGRLEENPVSAMQMESARSLDVRVKSSMKMEWSHDRYRYSFQSYRPSRILNQ